MSARLLLTSRLTQLRKWLASGQTTIGQVVAATKQQLLRMQSLNAFVTLNERFDSDAIALSEDSGRLGRLLAGVPMAVKDNFCTRQLRTTCASRLLENFVPPYDATVVARLRSAGALLVGKTNMDEFGMGSYNLHSAFGPVLNPWAPATVPHCAGGSSGGSAAAVAAGCAFGAIGSDTGGSVRQPAAYCGLVGFKPSYGRLSRFGLVAYASSLDTPGILARCVEDAALIFDALSGHDPNDSTSIVEAPLQTHSDLQTSIASLRIAVPLEYNVTELSAEMRATWQTVAQRFADAGASVTAAHLPHTKFSLAAYYVIAPAEASSNLARYDGLRYGRTSAGHSTTEITVNSRSQGFGSEVQRRIILGTFALSRNSYKQYFRHAQQVRRLVSEDFARCFDESGVDVLLVPASATTALPIEAIKSQDPMLEYLSDIMTIPASLAGLPAIVVPVGLDRNGLPIGVQLIGKRLQDHRLLQTAAALEKLFGFDAFAPRCFD